VLPWLIINRLKAECRAQARVLEPRRITKVVMAELLLAKRIRSCEDGRISPAVFSEPGDRMAFAHSQNTLGVRHDLDSHLRAIAKLARRHAAMFASNLARSADLPHKVSPGLPCSPARSQPERGAGPRGAPQGEHKDARPAFRTEKEIQADPCARWRQLDDNRRKNGSTDQSAVLCA
jgi:hypothetical protein